MFLVTHKLKMYFCIYYNITLTILNVFVLVNILTSEYTTLKSVLGPYRYRVALC